MKPIIMVSSIEGHKYLFLIDPKTAAGIVFFPDEETMRLHFELTQEKIRNKVISSEMIIRYYWKELLATSYFN